MRASSIRVEIKINDSVIVQLLKRRKKRKGRRMKLYDAERKSSNCCYYCFYYYYYYYFLLKKNFPCWNDWETDGVPCDEITRMLIKWNFCRLKLQFSLRVVLAKRDKTCSSSCFLAENQFRSSIRRFVNRFPFFFFFFLMLFIPPLLFCGSTRSPREGGKRFTRFADCRLKVHICTGANINLPVQIRCRWKIIYAPRCRYRCLW